MKVKYVRT